jgi:hypothetical protein
MLDASWASVRGWLRRLGIRYPWMHKVVNTRESLVVWLVLQALNLGLKRNPGLLEPLRRALNTVEAALLFPPLDRW